MRPMTVPFGRGAIDLSQLAPKAPAPPGATYVVEITDGNFDAVVRVSNQAPLVVEFYSPRAPEQAQLSADLAALANEAAGRFLLGRVNVDAAAPVAAAFQVQAVPTVVGVLNGQVAPLWQGTLSKVEAATYIDQLLQVAASTGVVGRAQPVAPATGSAAETGPDPRFAAADAALERGDFAAAVVEFEKLIAQNPADSEALAGRAQAGLLLRTVELDPEVVASRLEANPDEFSTILEAADLDVAAGRLEDAFERLLRVIRERPGPDRDAARVRLLELFEAVGNADPAVIAGRRGLMSALF